MNDRKASGRSAPPRRATGRDTAGTRASSAAARRALRREQMGVEPRLVLGRTHYLLLAGLVSIVAGFLLLAQRDITVAPILLVLGYCGLIPAGLLWRGLPGLRPRRNVAGEGRDQTVGSVGE